MPCAAIPDGRLKPQLPPEYTLTVRAVPRCGDGPCCEGDGPRTKDSATVRPAAAATAAPAAHTCLTWLWPPCAHDLRSAVVGDGGVVVAASGACAAAGHENPAAARGQRGGGVGAAGRAVVPPDPDPGAGADVVGDGGVVVVGGPAAPVGPGDVYPAVAGSGHRVRDVREV